MARTSMMAKLVKKPKYKIRHRNRCLLCGRPRGYLRKFKPTGTPHYYWGRLDKEFDIVHGKDGRHADWLTYISEKQPAMSAT